MKEILDILLKLITDFRVLIAFVGVVLYLKFVMYISSYTKSKNAGKGKNRQKSSAPTNIDADVSGQVGEIPDPD